jgi:hypothetical protein
MSGRIISLLLTIILLLSQPTYSQVITDLVTDRPDKTESPIVIPFNSFQIETGFIYEKQKFDESGNRIEIDNLTLLNTLFRYSSSSNIEFRFAGEYFNQDLKVNYHSDRISGIQNLMVGMKYQFRRNEFVLSNVALILQIGLPFGNRELRPMKLEPELILSFDQDFQDLGNLGVNLGSSYESERNNNFFIYSGSFGINLTKKLSSFVEIYGEVFPGEKSDNLIDCGITYLFNTNLQADISFGSSVQNQFNNWFLSFGIAVRFLNKN